MTYPPPQWGSNKIVSSSGESVDDMAESTSKLRAQVYALTNVKGTGGVDIMADATTFKSTYDIMKEISDVWKDMNDVDQAALLELLAGKVRSNQAAALLNNFDRAEGALETAQKSAGTMDRVHARWMDSIEARQQQFEAAQQSFSQTLISSDLMKSGYQTGTSVLGLLQNIVGGNGTGFLGQGLLGIGTGTGMIGSLASLMTTFGLFRSGNGNIWGGLNGLVGKYKGVDGGYHRANGKWIAAYNNAYNESGNKEQAYQEATNAVIKNGKALDGYTQQLYDSAKGTISASKTVSLFSKAVTGVKNVVGNVITGLATTALTGAAMTAINAGIEWISDNIVNRSEHLRSEADTAQTEYKTQKASGESLQEQIETKENKIKEVQAQGENADANELIQLRQELNELKAEKAVSDAKESYAAQKAAAASRASFVNDYTGEQNGFARGADSWAKILETLGSGDIIGAAQGATTNLLGGFFTSDVGIGMARTLLNQDWFKAFIRWTGRTPVDANVSDRELIQALSGNVNREIGAEMPEMDEAKIAQLTNEEKAQLFKDIGSLFSGEGTENIKKNPLEAMTAYQTMLGLYDELNDLVNNGQLDATKIDGNKALLASAQSKLAIGNTELLETAMDYVFASIQHGENGYSLDVGSLDQTIVDALPMLLAIDKMVSGKDDGAISQAYSVLKALGQSDALKEITENWAKKGTANKEAEDAVREYMEGYSDLLSIFGLSADDMVSYIRESVSSAEHDVAEAKKVVAWENNRDRVKAIQEAAAGGEEVWKSSGYTGSISEADYQKIAAMGDEYLNAMEYTHGGMFFNKKKFDEIVEEKYKGEFDQLRQDAQQKQKEYAEAAQKLMDNIQTRDNLKARGESTADLDKQIAEDYKTVSSYATQVAGYRRLGIQLLSEDSQYSRWLTQQQNQTESWDMFKNIATAYNQFTSGEAKKTYGTNEYHAARSLFFGDTAQGDINQRDRQMLKSYFNPGNGVSELSIVRTMQNDLIKAGVLEGNGALKDGQTYETIAEQFNKTFGTHFTADLMEAMFGYMNAFVDDESKKYWFKNSDMADNQEELARYQAIQESNAAFKAYQEAYEAQEKAQAQFDAINTKEDATDAERQAAASALDVANRNLTDAGTRLTNAATALNSSADKLSDSADKQGGGAGGESEGGSGAGDQGTAKGAGAGATGGHRTFSFSDWDNTKGGAETTVAGAPVGQSMPPRTPKPSQSAKVTAQAGSETQAANATETLAVNAESADIEAAQITVEAPGEQGKTDGGREAPALPSWGATQITIPETPPAQAEVSSAAASMAHNYAANGQLWGLPTAWRDAGRMNEVSDWFYGLSGDEPYYDRAAELMNKFVQSSTQQGKGIESGFLVDDLRRLQETAQVGARFSEMIDSLQKGVVSGEVNDQQTQAAIDETQARWNEYLRTGNAELLIDLAGDMQRAIDTTRGRRLRDANTLDRELGFVDDEELDALWEQFDEAARSSKTDEVDAAYNQYLPLVEARLKEIAQGRYDRLQEQADSLSQLLTDDERAQLDSALEYAGIAMQNGGLGITEAESSVQALYDKKTQELSDELWHTMQRGLAGSRDDRERRGTLSEFGDLYEQAMEAYGSSEADRDPHALYNALQELNRFLAQEAQQTQQEQYEQTQNDLRDQLGKLTKGDLWKSSKQAYSQMDTLKNQIAEAVDRGDFERAQELLGTLETLRNTTEERYNKQIQDLETRKSQLQNQRADQSLKVAAGEWEGLTQEMNDLWANLDAAFVGGDPEKIGKALDDIENAIQEEETQQATIKAEKAAAELNQKLDDLESQRADIVSGKQWKTATDEQKNKLEGLQQDFQSAIDNKDVEGAQTVLQAMQELWTEVLDDFDEQADALRASLQGTGEGLDKDQQADLSRLGQAMEQALDEGDLETAKAYAGLITKMSKQYRHDKQRRTQKAEAQAIADELLNDPAFQHNEEAAAQANALAQSVTGTSTLGQATTDLAALQELVRTTRQQYQQQMQDLEARETTLSGVGTQYGIDKVQGLYGESQQEQNIGDLWDALDTAKLTGNPKQISDALDAIEQWYKTEELRQAERDEAAEETQKLKAERQATEDNLWDTYSKLFSNAGKTKMDDKAASDMVDGWFANMSQAIESGNFDAAGLWAALINGVLEQAKRDEQDKQNRAAEKAAREADIDAREAQKKAAFKNTQDVLNGFYERLSNRVAEQGEGYNLSDNVEDMNARNKAFSDQLQEMADFITQGDFGSAAKKWAEISQALDEEQAQITARGEASAWQKQLQDISEDARANSETQQRAAELLGQYADQVTEGDAESTAAWSEAAAKMVAAGKAQINAQKAQDEMLTQQENAPADLLADALDAYANTYAQVTQRLKQGNLTAEEKAALNALAEPAAAVDKRDAESVNAWVQSAQEALAGVKSPAPLTTVPDIGSTIDGILTDRMSAWGEKLSELRGSGNISMQQLADLNGFNSDVNNAFAAYVANRSEENRQALEDALDAAEQKARGVEGSTKWTFGAWEPETTEEQAPAGAGESQKPGAGYVNPNWNPITGLSPELMAQMEAEVARLAAINQQEAEAAEAASKQAEEETAAAAAAAEAQKPEPQPGPAPAPQTTPAPTQAAQPVSAPVIEVNGNVDLNSRNVVPAKDMFAAGWEEFGAEEMAGAYATLYSSTYNGNGFTALATPITAEGNVLSPDELDQYIGGLLDQAHTLEELLDLDKVENGGRGLLVSAVESEAQEAIDRMGEFGAELHNAQESQYAAQAQALAKAQSQQRFDELKAMADELGVSENFGNDFQNVSSYLGVGDTKNANDLMDTITETLGELQQAAHDMQNAADTQEQAAQQEAALTPEQRLAQLQDRAKGMGLSEDFANDFQNARDYLGVGDDKNASDVLDNVENVLNGIEPPEPVEIPVEQPETVTVQVETTAAAAQNEIDSIQGTTVSVAVVADTSGVDDALSSLGSNNAAGGGGSSGKDAPNYVYGAAEGENFAAKSTYLVDERGQELIEHVGRGTYELGTNQGARFTKLDRGDIVHTAEETRKILKRHGSGNKAFAYGSQTAYVVDNDGKAKAPGISGGDGPGYDPALADRIAGWMADAQAQAQQQMMQHMSQASQQASDSLVALASGAQRLLKWIKGVMDYIPQRLKILKRSTNSFIRAAELTVNYIGKNNELTSAIGSIADEMAANQAAIEKYNEFLQHLQSEFGLSDQMVEDLKSGKIDIEVYAGADSAMRAAAGQVGVQSWQDAGSHSSGTSADNPYWLSAYGISGQDLLSGTASLQSLKEGGDEKAPENIVKALQTYQQWYDKLLACQDALDSLEDQMRALNKQKLDNIITYFKNIDTLIQDQVTGLENLVDLKNAYGWEVKESDYSRALQLTSDMIDNLSRETAALSAEMAAQLGVRGTTMDAVIAGGKQVWETIATYVKKGVEAPESAIEELANMLGVDVTSGSEDALKNLADLKALLNTTWDNPLAVGSDTWYAYTDTLTQLQSSLTQTEIKLQELADTMARIPIDHLQTGYDYLERINRSMEQLISLREAQGGAVSVNTYKTLISNGNKEIENLEMQNELIRQQMDGLDVLSEKYKELKDELDNNLETIMDIRIDQEKWNDAIIDLDISRLQKQNDKYKEQLSLMRSLDDLERAKQRRVLMYDEATGGFTYVEDEDAVEDALDSVHDAVFQHTISQLEDLKERSNIYGSLGERLTMGGSVLDYMGNQLVPVEDMLSGISFDNYFASIMSGMEQTGLLASMLNTIDMADVLQGSLGGDVHIDLSGMTLEGIDNARELGDAIIKQLPGYLLQYLYGKGSV